MKPGAVSEIFGNKPVTEKERALGKGRESFHKKKLKKKKSCPFVAGGRDYADGVSERVRQMPSVCLERRVPRKRNANLVNKKLGLEMVKICPASAG